METVMRQHVLPNGHTIAITTSCVPNEAAAHAFVTKYHASVIWLG